MWAGRLVFLVIICASSVVHAAGFASNQNFVVYTPDGVSQEEEQQFAETVLERAESFRQEFALQWLGAELANGSGRSVIYIDFSAREDRGLTWAIDEPGRLFHNVYLTTSPEKAAGSTLYHELVHSILATQFPHPNRLPPWAEEGIASRFDDETRHADREQLIRFWVQSGKAIDLAQLLGQSDIKSLDESAYAAATSLVAFLLTRADEQTLLRFAEEGPQTGWAAALVAHYGISSLEELQTQWEAWLTTQFGAN